MNYNINIKKKLLDSVFRMIAKIHWALLCFICLGQLYKPQH